MAGKTKQSEPKMRLDLRAKMYIVLVICSLMLLASVGVAFFLVGGFGSSEDAASDSAVEPESIITESGYNKEENTIDTTAYSATILPESSDAGQTYVDETLFLGDSNTARMYRMFDFCTYDNAIGSVGMSAKSLATYACVELNNSGSYVTMAKAVAGMQPKRVIITFGTNDLSPSYKAADFVKNYQTGIESIVEAYPSVDILINAIPPLGQQHSNQSLTQTQVDEYNKALVEMCKEKGWKFLNSAEVLKDSATGYAKSGYVESSDGIHLTRAAMEALFDYIRTHSCITEDDRPTVTKVAKHTSEKDVVTYTTPVVTSTASSEEYTSDTEEEEESSSSTIWYEPSSSTSSSSEESSSSSSESESTASSSSSESTSDSSSSSSSEAASDITSASESTNEPASSSSSATDGNDTDTSDENAPDNGEATSE